MQTILQICLQLSLQTYPEINEHICPDISADISADISVDISAYIYRYVCRSISRYICRHTLTAICRMWLGAMHAATCDHMACRGRLGGRLGVTWHGWARLGTAAIVTATTYTVVIRCGWVLLYLHTYVCTCLFVYFKHYYSRKHENTRTIKRGRSQPQQDFFLL